MKWNLLNLIVVICSYYVVIMIDLIFPEKLHVEYGHHTVQSAH